MYQLTQGTIIYGIRSTKYPDVVCNGIVLSARCDLANCKVDNVYYSVAIPCDEWLVSEEGFHTALAGKIKDIECKIEKWLQTQLLDWDTMKGFTCDEFEKVLDVQCPDTKKKERSDLVDQFKTYSVYTSQALPQETKREVLSKEKKYISTFLSNIAGGQASHFAYIPQDAYRANGCLDNGLIVDLQELERIDAKTVDLICAYAVDSKNEDLPEPQIALYNKQFFLHNGPGYASPDCDIESPWIEYLMQRFSNSFIRIGVDGPQKDNVAALIKRVCEGGEQ